MAELSRETRLTCASNLYFQTSVPSTSGRGVYVCTYEKMPRGEPYAMGWVCTCPAYKFGARNANGMRQCKHTRIAEGRRCGYGWEAFCGDRPSADKQGNCPHCGGEMKPITVGV